VLINDHPKLEGLAGRMKQFASNCTRFEISSTENQMERNLNLEANGSF
jgi:hypothetical protein